MPPTEHSEFSPSSMDAKMKCHGRHLATLGLEGEGSSYAERGTECHDWAEKLFITAVNPLIPLPSAPNFPEDWQEECANQMVDQAVEMFDTMSLHGQVTYQTEKRVDLGLYQTDAFDLSRVFGTVDLVLHCQDTNILSIVDYKTGVGVRVNPVDNVQLMIYALGAARLFPDPPETINICISQPRLEPTLQIWETTFSELVAWLYDKLVPALVAMSKPGATFTPGERQCRWCPIKGKCKAQRDEMLALFDTPATDVSGTSPTISDEEIDTIMLRLPEFKQWLGQIEQTAMGILEGGGELEHFKLVRGRSNRQWGDTERADRWLTSQKLKEKERYTFKLISPAQAEKVLKETLKTPRVRTNFEKLVIKPEGSLSWALKTDPREAVQVHKPEHFVDLKDLL